MRFFMELNPVVDEWTGSRGYGLFTARGWCLIGLYIIWPDYFAAVILNRGFGIYRNG